MEASNPDLTILEDIIAKAIKGGPPAQSLSSASSEHMAIKKARSVPRGTIAGGMSHLPEVSIRKHLLTAGIAGNSELRALAQSRGPPTPLRIRPIREPFGPPASGHRGFTHIRPGASVSIVSTTSMALAKVHSQPQAMTTPTIFNQPSSAIVQHSVRDDTTAISITNGSVAHCWRHAKSHSEPILPTQPGVEGAKKVFEHMFAKMAAKREEEDPSLAAFKCSSMLLEQRGLCDTKPAVHVPVHPYKGDMSSRSFLAQIPDLDDVENCALWIENVPVDVAEAEFFKAIKTGAVWCLHINSADKDHPEQAAKLVFSKCLCNPLFLFWTLE
jgi:hypothetical protein